MSTSGSQPLQGLWRTRGTYVELLITKQENIRLRLIFWTVNLQPLSYSWCIFNFYTYFYFMCTYICVCIYRYTHMCIYRYVIYTHNICTGEIWTQIKTKAETDCSGILSTVTPIGVSNLELPIYYISIFCSTWGINDNFIWRPFLLFFLYWQ